jgi:hypothetical protein
MMKYKIGDLVKYVGVATYYKGAIGVVSKVYNTYGLQGGRLHLEDSATVYIANRPLGRSQQIGATPGYHPFSFSELESIK